jgi:hypothetical protein
MKRARTIFFSIAVLLICACIFCYGRGNVLITGTITQYNARTDSIFVTLTHNWESIMLAPDNFTIKSNGRFELQFRVGRNPPPVTFIKNRSVYAKLMLKSLWDPSPVIIDEVRNEIFDVKVKENGLFTAKVDL